MRGFLRQLSGYPLPGSKQNTRDSTTPIQGPATNQPRAPAPLLIQHCRALALTLPQYQTTEEMTEANNMN